VSTEPQICLGIRHGDAEAFGTIGAAYAAAACLSPSFLNRSGIRWDEVRAVLGSDSPEWVGGIMLIDFTRRVSLWCSEHATKQALRTSLRSVGVFNELGACYAHLLAGTAAFTVQDHRGEFIEEETSIDEVRELFADLQKAGFEYNTDREMFENHREAFTLSNRAYDWLYRKELVVRPADWKLNDWRYDDFPTEDHAARAVNAFLQEQGWRSRFIVP